MNVRAGISERNMFASLSNWFASSFSVLGELMQNARRAEATEVRFTLDGNDLVIQDDGVGIEDFQDLVQFAESGWKVETRIAESPFGMGFFSTLYCAEAVTIQSRGRKLQVRLTDVLDRRELAVVDDPNPVTVGTRITMHHLDSKFTQKMPRYVGNEDKLRIQHELVFRSMGFPIPVIYNGESLPRPHAKCNRQGIQTDTGFWSILGVHEQPDAEVLPKSQVSYYLQGLPIAYTSSESDRRNNVVVHLDGVSDCVPLMPDRNRIKDENKVMERCAKQLHVILGQHLAEEKTRLSAEDFLLKWYEIARQNEHCELLNDIPVLPASAFATVDCASYNSQNTWGGRLRRPDEAMVYAKDIAEGRVNVWRNAPSSANDGPLATAILKVMQWDQTLSLYDSLHGDHWINKLSRDAKDLVVKVTPGELIGQGVMPDTGSVNCDLHLVERFSVRVTSMTDLDFVLEHVVIDDWIVMPSGENGKDWQADDYDLTADNVCYMTVTDKSPDRPIHVFSDFTDEHDYYDESWEEAAIERFASLVRGLRGLPLDQTVRNAIEGIDVQPSQIACLTVVVPKVRWDSYRGACNLAHLSSRNLDQDVWAAFASRLNGSVSAQALQQAFSDVLLPGELIGVDNEGRELLCAAGYTPRQSGPASWLALLPGVTSPDFEAEDHNYLGLFSSEQDMVEDILPDVMRETADHHGLSDEALQGMPFPERYRLVREAHPRKD